MNTHLMNQVFGASTLPAEAFMGPVHRVLHFLMGVQMYWPTSNPPPKRMHPSALSLFPSIHAFSLHRYWNACFFMYRTVDARTRYTLKQQSGKKDA